MRDWRARHGRRVSQALEVMSSLRWTVRWLRIYGFKSRLVGLLPFVPPPIDARSRTNPCRHDMGGWLFPRLKAYSLFPKDLSETSEDASETATLALLAVGGSTTEEHAQHACQACCVDAIALLALTQEGEEAGGDGGEDAAHRLGGHTRLLRNAADNRRQVAAEDMAQDLGAIGQVGGLQCTEDVASVDGMVAEGL